MFAEIHKGQQKASAAPRYCDYYGMLSYKDFLRLESAGTLTEHAISERTDLETK
jgi:hypothetical protein